MMNLFRIPNKPTALPSKLFPNEDGEYTWEDWEQEAKNTYPIRYFLLETLPFWWRVNIVSPIFKFWYFVKSYIVPQKRYHMLDLRQPHNEKGHDNYRYGWIDSDTQILFACFNILTRFIENEHGGLEKYLEYVKYQESVFEQEGIAIDSDRREIYDLYVWWKKGRKEQLENYNNALHTWNILFSALKTKKERDDSVELKKADAVLKNLEKEVKFEETKRLCRLIELREYLWT